MSGLEIIENLKKGITVSMGNDSVPVFLKWMEQEKAMLPGMTFAVQKFKERSHLIPVQIDVKNLQNPQKKAEDAESKKR